MFFCNFGNFRVSFWLGNFRGLGDAFFDSVEVLVGDLKHPYVGDFDDSRARCFSEEHIAVFSPAEAVVVLFLEFSCNII